MKLVSFNCTIEVSKDENGYSNNYYVTIDENGVSVSNPYTRMTPEQAVFATELIRDFIGMSMNYNARVDSFNRDMLLEQYAPQVATTEETASGVSTETTEETEPRSPEGSNSTNSSEELMETKVDEEEVEEKSLAKTIEDNVIESLGLK